MTKTAQRKITSQLRIMRADRKAWLTGQHLHEGVPWCIGRGSQHCEGGGCMGCASVLYCRDRATEIDEKIRCLAAILAPVPAVQGWLW